MLPSMQYKGLYVIFKHKTKFGEVKSHIIRICKHMQCIISVQLSQNNLAKKIEHVKLLCWLDISFIKLEKKS